MKALLLIIHIIAFMVVKAEHQGARAGTETTTTKSKEIPRVMCGRVLAEARMIYCADKFYREKRLGNGPNTVKKQLLDTSLLLQKKQACALASSSIIKGSGRAKRGLVDECCYNACYISQIVEYC